jgi:uncharacterized protein YjiS (DUF1127 family)
MSIQSSVAPHGALAGRGAREGDGLLTRVYKAIIRAREAQAQRLVQRHLSYMTDEQLNDLGFTPEEIHRTRVAGQAPVSYWS